MIEIAEHMIWIRRLGKLSLVTLVAVGVMQLVVASDMAGLALQRNMRSRQGEKRGIVVECCGAPICCRVTLRAIMTEVPRHVIRVRRLLELLLMTLVAIGIHQLIVTIHMT